MVGRLPPFVKQLSAVSILSTLLCPASPHFSARLGSGFYYFCCLSSRGNCGMHLSVLLTGSLMFMFIGTGDCDERERHHQYSHSINGTSHGVVPATKSDEFASPQAGLGHCTGI